MNIEKIAKLAHLEITEEEVALYAPQMEDIVAYVEQLNEVDTNNIEDSIGGLTTEGKITKADRKDIPQKSLGQKSALDQAPSLVEGYFQVPKVLLRNE